MEVGSDAIGQSAAINYYLASEFGLMGSNNLEAAQIISIAEHLKEMMTAFRQVLPYGTEPTEELLEKWFESGATDSTGPADRAGYSSRFLKWWMGRIEQTLGSNGFAVGGKLSLADVLIYNIFAEHLKPEEYGEGVAQWRGEPFGSTARTEAALAAHPKIKACCDSVAANANVQQWLATRGKQGF